MTKAEPTRRYFEDLTIDEPILVGSYTPSRFEAIELARRWEPQPYHLDEEAARASIYGGLTLCSLHLFAICTRLFFDMAKPIAVLGMMGKDELRLPAPARPDQPLHYWTRCSEKRDSRSKDDRGIVTLDDRLEDPDAGAVLTQRVTLLVARRS